jgi:hypothetical protein
MPFAKKVTATEALGKTLATAPLEAVNGLFFMARNGAISHLLRAFEHHFQEQGMTVRAAWHETSFPRTAVRLTLKDKRGGEHARSLAIERTVATRDARVPSELVYALQSIQVSEYYRGKPPKAAVDFDAVLATPAFEALARTLINGANYPFTYASHSSF